MESSSGDRTRSEFRSADRIEGLMTFQGLTQKKLSPSPFGMIHYVADHLRAADLEAVTALVDSIRLVKKDLE